MLNVDSLPINTSATSLSIPSDEFLSEHLDLPNIPDNVYNPLELKYGKVDDPIENLIHLSLNKEYLHFACRYLLNVKLLPYQLVMLDTFWNKKQIVLVGGRGIAKTFVMAVFILLKMVLSPGIKVVIVGSGLRQAVQVHNYMANIWRESPILRDIAGKAKDMGPRRETDKFQFRIGNSFCFAIPLGDGQKIRGMRANLIIADEFFTIDPTIFNLVVKNFASVAQDVTQKTEHASMVRLMKKKGLWTQELEEVEKANSDGNQIIMSGSATVSFNHFGKYYDLWRRIILSKGDLNVARELFGDDEDMIKGFNWHDYAVLRIPYTALPEGVLDEGIIAQAKATLTKNQFLQEYCATFTSDTDGFYKMSLIEGATTYKPIMVNGQRIQFTGLLQSDLKYPCVMGVDPAAERDNAAIVIIEMREGHRRVVYCWTTNEDKHKKIRQEHGLKIDYYEHIADKIKSLMKVFNIERIMMDQNGGGRAIAEALRRKDNLKHGYYPVYQIIDPKEPKMEDQEEGPHILEMVAPTQDFNAEANHGMKKDFEDKILLFPYFDSVQIAAAALIDEANKLVTDNYEDLAFEIEEMKKELSYIVVTPSPVLGKETFDTTAIKLDGSNKKVRLKKDRYSALLYANWHARNRDKIEPLFMDYTPAGEAKHVQKARGKEEHEGAMYTGLGPVAKNSWMSGNIRNYIIRN